MQSLKLSNDKHTFLHMACKAMCAFEMKRGNDEKGMKSAYMTFS